MLAIYKKSNYLLPFNILPREKKQGIAQICYEETLVYYNR